MSEYITERLAAGRHPQIINGIFRIDTDTADSNIAAQRLYEKVGTYKKLSKEKNKFNFKSPKRSK